MMISMEKKGFLLLVVLLVAGLVFWRPQILAYFAFVPTKSEGKESLSDYVTEEVFIKTADDVQLHTLYFAAPRQQGVSSHSHQVILYLHGNAGNLFNRVGAINELRAQGVNVLLIDYRGYGLSDGQITETGMYLDAEAAFQYLLNEKGFDKKNITVVGRSIGSVAALYLGVNYQPAAVILVSPLASALHMASEMGLGWLKWFAYGALNSVERATRIKSPVMIIHGDKDVMIPIEQGHEVFAALNLPDNKKQFITVNGANHHNIRSIAGVDYWHWMLRFMTQAQR